MSCECRTIRSLRQGRREIIYCPIHAAAPAMYEALKLALSCCDLREGNVQADVEKAIAQAEGK